MAKLSQAPDKGMSLESLEAALTEDDRRLMGQWAARRRPYLTLEKHLREAKRELDVGNLTREGARAVLALADEVATELKSRETDIRSRSKDATDGKRRQGDDTRRRVLEMAVALKRENPRLSKLAVAARIATGRRAPCGKDQAKRILDTEYDREAWKIVA